MGEREHELVHLLHIVDRNFKRSIDKKVGSTGVYRSQHKLLMMLGRHPDCSQTELAEKMEVSPAAIAVSLKKLEKGGFVSRQCHENDNRVNYVKVTEKGRKAIEVSIRYFQEIDEAMFADFTDEEIERLGGYLHRVIANGETYYQKLLRQES